MKHKRCCLLLILAVLAGSLLAPRPVCAWDYEGHRLINQLALSTLPTNFPQFVKTPATTERIGFLAGEPDRWRNVQDLPLRHGNGPEHYIDLEELATYGLKPELLPPFRYDFAAQLALVRNANPFKFAVPDAIKNEDHTRQLVGLLPWTITESYSKLKSSFASLNAFQEDGGTAEEIANARENVIYVMGIMGHYVADAAQPLHTTIHHHGWVGENPQHYSTNSRIHSWIDGGYLQKVGGVNTNNILKQLRAAHALTMDGREAKVAENFQAVMLFLIEQNKQVGPLYQLEKEGKISGNGAVGLQGVAFFESQYAKSAQFLADLWFSAWQQAPPDTFLKRQLASRKQGLTRTE